MSSFWKVHATHIETEVLSQGKLSRICTGVTSFRDVYGDHTDVHY